MKALKFIFLLFLLASCGTTFVNYDYETSTDFTQYKTYDYFGDMQTGLIKFDSIRIINAIDAKLSAMGFKRSESPDFYIDIQSKRLANRNSPNIGVGVGGGRGGGFGGVSVGVPLNSNKYTREITIDFVDKDQNERLFWQAVSESTFKGNASVEKREMTIAKLVDKIFEGYPPK